ncbi:hypothetical protein PPSIR1_38656 [Plesiocystis pacifica SIR-1]|uniref:Uncharacterized protein n=1 Tax=Plesiocystis pacifica SIR-1 TaxID=391625 RepID=A6G8Q4_9BACT|nr:hypothetical protein PPSIR1_38656 [Plesiocystis pacifica SIR-1]
MRAFKVLAQDDDLSRVGEDYGNAIEGNSASDGVEDYTCGFTELADIVGSPREGQARVGRDGLSEGPEEPARQVGDG